MTAEIVCLVLGVLAIAAAWDVARRVFAARDVETRVLARLAQVETKVAVQLDEADEHVTKRLANHAEHVSTIKRGVDAYVQQTTAEINALKSGMNIRTMRA